MDLYTEMMSKKCPENGDLQAHFTELIRMKKELASYGIEMTGSEFCAIAIRTVPNGYDGIIGTIAASTKKGELTAETIMQRTLDEYDRQSTK